MLRRIIFITLFISSCKEETIQYEFLVYRNNAVKMWQEPMSQSAIRAMENGRFTVDDVEGNVIAQGEFEDGLKVGQWIYHPSDTQTVRVEWSKYSSGDSTVVGNFPNNWKIDSLNSGYFRAALQDSTETGRDKFFVVTPQNKDSIDMDLNSYWNSYTRHVFESANVKEYALFEFASTNKRTFFFSRYIVQKESEKILILTFLGESRNVIYDIAYSSSNTAYEKKHVIFFDVVRSLILDHERLLSPIDPIKNTIPRLKPEDLKNI